MLGGAAGDALGGAVEFFSEEMIFRTFGEEGVTRYTGGIGYITDDTQMALFTADGLLRAFERDGRNATGGAFLKSVYDSYLDWYYTQSGERIGERVSGLLQYKELFSRRAPGQSCLAALASGRMGTIDRPINNSKGCGGIMRAAPVALFFSHRDVSLEDIDLLAAKTSAITHGHELGYIPSATLCDILCRIINGESLPQAVERSLQTIKRLFSEARHIDYFVSLIQRAADLSRDRDTADDLDAIRELGEGWVAEETLAIAVYCALRYENDFEKAVIASVNHGGDSDSTGAVTGNLMGAYLGIGAIPPKFTEKLELRDLIVHLAERMATE